MRIMSDYGIVAAKAIPYMITFASTICCDRPEDRVLRDNIFQVRNAVDLDEFDLKISYHSIPSDLIDGFYIPILIAFTCKDGPIDSRSANRGGRSKIPSGGRRFRHSKHFTRRLTGVSPP